MLSQHAVQRAKDRGIPPLIREWLFEFGEEVFDGHGGIQRFFTRRSIRTMERRFGREPLRRLSEFLDVYLIESTRDGTTITIGHRTRRVLRS